MSVRVGLVGVVMLATAQAALAADQPILPQPQVEAVRMAPHAPKPNALYTTGRRLHVLGNLVGGAGAGAVVLGFGLASAVNTKDRDGLYNTGLVLGLAGALTLQTGSFMSSIGAIRADRGVGGKAALGWVAMGVATAQIMAVGPLASRVDSRYAFFTLALPAAVWGLSVTQMQLAKCRYKQPALTAAVVPTLRGATVVGRF